MKIHNKDGPLRIYDDEGYYELERVSSLSGESIVRAAYYNADGECDPVRTAAVPNLILLEQFKLALVNDLIADKDGLAHVMEEIFQTIARQQGS